MRSLAFIALAATCQPSRADPPKQEPPDQQFERNMMIRFHMHENFDLLRAIERLVIRGKLDDARRFATALAEAPDEPGLSAWATHTTAVRERAAALARAPTTDEACRREARLAAACAGCHVETGVTPEFRTHPQPPPDEPTIAARMARHRWAADRLWEGVVGGAEEPWKAGLDILAATPLDWKSIAPERAPFGKELQRRADQARRGKTIDTGAYGEILATCAGCHTMH
jgi:hypothetical protein